MNWLLSLVVAILSAVTGGVGAVLVGEVFVEWFHVPSREGEAGYFVVGIGLFGLIGGFIIGLICARVFAANASPSFLKALGVSFGVSTGVLLLVLGLGWLSADFPPRIDGRVLMLDVEVGFPSKIQLPEPQADDLYRWYVTVTASSGSRRQTSANLRLSEVSQVEGRKIVSASVFLGTSDAGRSLGVGCGDYGEQFFNLLLPSKPTYADMEWSSWLTTPHAGDLSPIPDDMAVAVRYRVRLDERPR